MANTTLTANTAVPVTLAPGTPVSFTGDGTHAILIYMGFSAAGANGGVLIATTPSSATPVSWAWPGIFINFGVTTLYLYSAAYTSTITFPS